MSDLEASLRRIGGAAAPVSHAAIGKLQSHFGKQGNLFAQSKGLVDAFADVFANIAQSQAAATEASQRDSAVDVAPDRDVTLASDPKQSQQRDVDRGNRQSNEDRQNDPNSEAVVRHDDNVSDATREEASSETNVDDSDVMPSVVDVPVETTKQSEEVDAPTVVAVETLTTTQTSSDEEGQQQESSKRRTDGQHSGALSATERAAAAQPTDESAADIVTKTPGDSAGTNEQQSGESSTGDNAEPQLPEESLTGEDSRDAKSGLADRSDTSSNRKRDSSKVASSGNAASAADAPRPSAESAESTPVSRPVSSPQVTHAAATASTTATSQTNSSQNQAGNVRTRTFTQAIESVNQTEVKSDSKPKETQHTTSETVSRAKLVQRVSKAFHHLGNEGGIVRMRLAPAELGSVRVEMRVQNRKVEARVVAETEAASAALRQFLPDLRQRLEAQGMQVERIEIESENSDDSSRGSFGGFDRGDQSEQQPRRRSSLSQSQANSRESVSQEVSRVDKQSQAARYVAVPGGVDARF